MSTESETLLPTSSAKMLAIAGTAIPAPIINLFSLDSEEFAFLYASFSLLFFASSTTLGSYHLRSSSVFEIAGKMFVSYAFSFLILSLISDYTGLGNFEKFDHKAITNTSLIMLFLTSLYAIKESFTADRLRPDSTGNTHMLIAATKKAKELNRIIMGFDESGTPFKMPLISIITSISAAKFHGLEPGYISFTPNNYPSIRLRIKRHIDLIISIFMIFLLSPVMIAVFIAVKLSSPGPAIFKQKRVGKFGKEFTMFKFRSMTHDAEKHVKSLNHLNERDGPTFKISNDPRITKVGKFLRKFSLDELPQLFNVLIGDMSLVGPRPPLPSEVINYEIWQHRRLSMKPGITCEWQVKERGAPGFSRWVNLDLHYIDNWSIARDISILIRTIPAVLSGRGSS